ncbi:unnamed protein product, partial [Meganyctiphanes norvegica]
VTIPFDSLESMLNQDVIPFTTANNNPLHQAWMKASRTDPTSLFAKANRKMAPPFTVWSDLYAKTMGGQVANCIDWSTGKFLLHSHFSGTAECPVYAVPTEFGNTFTVIGIRKNWKHKELLDQTMQRLREFGILEYLMNREIRNATNCLTKPGSETLGVLRPLQIEDFIGVFGIFAGGLIMAVMVLFGEMILNCLLQQKSGNEIVNLDEFDNSKANETYNLDYNQEEYTI